MATAQYLVVYIANTIILRDKVTFPANIHSDVILKTKLMLCGAGN